MSDRTSRPWLRRLTGRALPGTPLDLEQAAGLGSTLRDRRARGHAWQPVEQLEARVLLAGDHPSFSDFPNADDLPAFDADGRTSDTGVIGSPTDDDVFRFQAPMDADFISILADTVNTAVASTLNSRVRVYDSNGNQLTRMGVPIDGRNNGILSTTRPGVATDGWLNFIATPGEFYFVRVSGENGTSGPYVVRVNAGVTELTPSPTHDNAGQVTAGEVFIPAGPDRNQPPLGGDGQIIPLPTDATAQRIQFPQDERVYRISAPDDAIYDSLATATARSDRTNPAPLGGFLDTHLEIYDENGNLLASDIETGYLNDAFATWRVRPGQTFYIRVRGDDLRDPDSFPSIGNYQLRVDLSAFEFDISDVTRRGDLDSAIGALMIPTPPAEQANVLLLNEDSGLFRFKAEGSGLAIITARFTAAPHDVTLRVYNSEGTQIAFNDDFNGTDARVFVNVVGNEHYFVIVDGFDDNVSGWNSTFNIWVEANHTFDPTSPVDDHADAPPFDSTGDARRRAFERATALRFNQPTLIFDDNGNPVPDRGHVTSAFHSGRIHPATDSDIFQFIAPVDMLNTYEGDNDDAGAALFAGGRIDTADPLGLYPRIAGAVSIWDAADWWFLGAQGEVDGFEFGFVDNPATPGTTGAEVYVMREIDVDGGGPFLPAVAVGGDFIIRLPNGQEILNLAIWQFVPLIGAYVWLPFGDPDGAVRAIETYDPVTFDPDGGGPTVPVPDPAPNMLFVGGDFSNIGGAPADRIASTLDGVAWTQVAGGWGGGATGSVRALAVYDPIDPGDERAANPGPPNLPLVADTPDHPISLIIGGRGDTGALLKRWDGVTLHDGLVSGTPVPSGAIVGNSINALAVYDPPDVDGDGELEDDGPFLYIGGDFTSIGGVVSPNIIQWGRAATVERGDDFVDPEEPVFQPRVLYDPVNEDPLNAGSPAGTDGPVNALTVWDPPNVAGDNENELAPVLVIGGEFTIAGATDALNVVHWGGGGTLPFAGFVGLTSGGVPGPVHALAVSVTRGGQSDEQEPSIPLLGASLDPQQVLYIGGEFEFPNVTQNIVQYHFDPDLLDFTLGALRSGLGMSDGSPSAVFALTFFDDQNPAIDNSEDFWDRHDRPGTRLEIVVSPTAEGFLDAGVRVYNSRYELVYPTSASAPWSIDPPGEDTPPVNDRIVPPPFSDPAGSLNPATAPGIEQNIIGIPLWGGETYYIEVVGVSGAGRYEMSVTVDALPPDLNGDGVFDSINHIIVEPPGAGQFADAVNIDRYLDSGDGRVYTANPIGAVTGRGNIYAYPSLNAGHTAWSEHAAIEQVTDEDLYSFIAEESGWVEVRTVTRAIGGLDPNNGENGDQYTDDFGPDGIPDAVLINQYNSYLDSALRIFNADFEEISFSDNFPGISGEFSTQNTGIFVREYTERDARTVFRVERGVKYYIQVESGQKPVFADDPGLVDWRHATGSYELLLNTMPELDETVDDHSDFGTFSPTPIPIGVFTPGGTPSEDLPNGVGRITGTIDDTAANPSDEDFMYMIAPTTGPVTATITVETPGLSLAVTIFNEFGQAVAQGGGAGTITLNWFAQQGDQYLVLVDGSSGEGAYAIDIATLPYLDDHADYFHWDDATPLVLSRFFGTFTGAGSIESPNDTDLFVFTAEAHEVASVTVNATGALDPVVTVFEVGEDPAGNPTFLRLNFNDDSGGGATNAATTFSVTPGRPYYVLVSGSDPNGDLGGYNVTVQVRSTDDHPDLADLPIASTIAIDYNANLGTGTGSATGVIERLEDEDLFSFIAPTNGEAAVVVTTEDSDLRPRVRLLNSQGQIIDDGTGSGGAVGIGGGGLVAGQQYYILVRPPLDLTDTPTTGAYSVDVTTTVADDHPDAEQWDTAQMQPIVLSQTSGFGSRSGQLLPFDDTDLFYFESVAAGQIVVEVVTPASNFDPQVTIFDAGRSEIRFSRGNTDTVTIIFTATAANQGFFVLVAPDGQAIPGTLTGAYSVRISGSTGGGGGGGGPDDHVNAGDWIGASLVSLDERTADGQRTGVINYLGDTDLFSVFTRNRGTVRVQVVAADGAALDASIKVYRGDQVQIAADALGIPGNTAYATFEAGGIGELYFILVEQVGPNVGPYTLMINAEPLTHYLYHPEGFSGSTIDEFIPVVNPNDFDVEYTIVARYEVGERDQVLATGTIKANSRGGITVSTKSGENPHNVRIGVPYAIEIQSTGQLGATLSHYDFGVTTGESFTERLSNTWFFSEARKSVDTFRDFLVVYNPNSTDTNVTFSLFYDDGTVTTFTRSVAAFRRGGVNFTTDGSVPKEGVFAVKIDSSLPIVAALSSFDIVNQRGFGLLGSPDGGTTEGVVPSITTGSGVESFVSIFNPGSSTATVTLRGSYQRADLPDLVQVITIGAGSRFAASLADLGLVPSQVAGLRYTSTAPVVFTAVQYRGGDGDATAAPTSAFTSALIGDAFINPAVAGITYVEELALYNPAGLDVNVTITFLFDDGSVGQFVNPSTGGPTINLGPDAFAFIRIDQQPAILNRPGLAFFSILIEAPTPIVATFNHYDFFLDGGWGTAPGPVGFSFPLTRI